MIDSKKSYNEYLKSDQKALGINSNSRFYKLKN